ncbi:MAG: tetratricopeptide repeat protein, partial [Candidatus Riflebacteria bacterium]|nr:tetratricopeptide repeat protein [Candidatus Riflebacteria bacterium]
MTNRPEPPVNPVSPAEVRALLAGGRLAEAAALAGRLPATPEGLALRARLLARTGDLAAGLALLTPGPAQPLPPGNWARHRAFLLLETGKPAEAGREFETALAAEPAARDLQLGLVDALELAGDPAAALARLETLLAADPAAP